MERNKRHQLPYMEIKARDTGEMSLQVRDMPCHKQSGRL